MGGEWFEELFGDPSTASKETILSTALDALREHLGITQQPSHTIVSIEKVQCTVLLCFAVIIMQSTLSGFHFEVFVGFHFEVFV